MKFQRKKGKMLIYVDLNDRCLFVLLLFFMVSTTFNQHTEVNIKLPEADAGDAEQHPKMVTLTIDGRWPLLLNGDDGLPHQLVNQSIDTLKQNCANLAEHSGQIPFIINADGKHHTKLLLQR